MSVFVKKYARYLILFSVTTVLLWILFTWRQLFLPFAVGLVLAYILFPLVKFIERHLPGEGPRWAKTKRIVAIFIAALTAIVVFGIIVYLSVNAIAGSSSNILENASHFIETAIARIQEWATSLGANLPESWQDSLDNIADSLGRMVDNIIQGLFANSGGVIASSFGVIFSFATLPLFLFYLLKDPEKLSRGVFNNLQPDVARHAKHVFGIIERTLGHYLRAQLILGAIVAFMTFVGLLFIAPEMAAPLALINGFFEIIPTIGPIIGGAIMVVVILAIAPDMVIWVIILAVAVQLLENNILVPRIQAATLRLHPAVVLFLLVTGSYLWGFWGLVFFVPIVAAFIEVFKYVHAIGNTTPPINTS